jgi:hypothetical protein
MFEVTIETTVPEDRRVTIDLPADTPVGPIRLRVQDEIADQVIEFVVPEFDVHQLPTYIDPRTGERKLVARSGVVKELGRER